MARVLVLQHHPAEHPGVFRELFAAAGIAGDAVEVDAGETIPDLGPYDAMMAMGGPQHVWQEDEHPWLVDEKRTVAAWVRSGRPFLGMCLGHQLLASAMGGYVGMMEKPEIGVLPVKLTREGFGDPLLRGLPDIVDVLQWHGAEVILPPPGAVVLASDARGAPQAIRVGQRGWGVQFHFEQTATTVDEWAAIPEYRDGLEQLWGAAGVGRLGGAVAAGMGQFRSVATAICGNFVATWYRRG